MTTTLLFVISAALHAAAFLLIIILFTRMSRLKEVEKTQKKMIHEVEEAVTSYIVEMKDENEEFLRALGEMITEIKREKKKQSSSPSVRDRVYTMPDLSVEDYTNTLTQDIGVYSKQNLIPRKQVVEKLQHQIIEENTPPVADLNPKHPKSYVEQVIWLKNQGKGAAEIAKLLNKGRVEVELLLKFHSL